MSEQKIEWSFISPSVDLTKIERGEPYVTLLSDEHTIQIGRIIFMWSIHSANMKTFSKYILSYFKRDIGRNSGENFKRAINLIGDARNGSCISEFARQLYLYTDEISLIRNSIVHGDLSWSARIQGNAAVPVITVAHQHKNTEINYEFSIEELEAIFYNLSKVCGQLNFLLTLEINWLQRKFTEKEISLVSKIFYGADAAGGSMLVAT